MAAALPFALRDGVFIGIEEAESGLACGCLCPACGEPVIARKGTRRTHHFSHQRGAVCPDALETTLHRMAKEILEQARRIRLPAVNLAQRELVLFGEQWLPFEKVYVEKRLPGLQPDLIIEARGKPVLVEIAVTHPTEWDKVRLLNRQRLAAIEIDLMTWSKDQEMRNQPITRQSLRSCLLFSTAYKRWLFNPRRHYLEAALRNTSDHKKVKRRYRQGHHRYTVSPCPLLRRIWRPSLGLSDGPTVSYADVFQDCLDCSFCLEINYRKEIRGFREIPTWPETVICWGKWNGKEEAIIDTLLATTR